MMNQAVVLICAFSCLLKPSSAQGDWRLEFLREANIETDPQSLRKLYQFHESTVDDLDRAILRLGADGQEKRNAAYEEILRMDRDMVLKHLQQLPESSEPEVRLRLDMVRKRIEWMEPWDSRDLLRVAAEGLLYEREHPGKTHSSRQMFVELFHQSSDSLQQGYRRMIWRGDQGLDGKVVDGLLHLSGKRPKIEGDQRLVLTAQSATGKATFPDRFRIDVKIGAKDGGEGGYHVGIAVGKVRALFHPGYDGGGFRFQRAHDPGELPSNQDMGFTPKSDSLCDMRVDVRRLAKNRVQLGVEIRGEQKTFRATQEFDEGVIGPLDQISIDRSGRVGGDALFRNLIVQFAPP
ncbi:MAG: hypothetical protein RI957_253 [Verrucomicrobiota bacterium]|jgi:hypothetical protein